MITGPSLLPAAIAVAGMAAGRLVDGVARGLSFARLQGGEDLPTTGQRPPTESTDQALETSVGQYAHRTALQRNIDRLSKELHAILAPELADRGIEMSQPAILEVDVNGRILEVGGHPERDRIELLFDSDSGLAGQLRSLLRQAQELYTTGPHDQSQQRVDSGQVVVHADEITLRHAS